MKPSLLPALFVAGLLGLPALAQVPTVGVPHAATARLPKLIASVQAGQLLEVAWPTGSPQLGTIRGAVLTGGAALAFDKVPGLEFSSATGALQVRVPAREVGSLELVRLEPQGVAGGLRRVQHSIQVTPPNLFDGVRVDGVFDAFEDALIAGHSVAQSASITMVDLNTGAAAGQVALDYSVATDAKNVYLRVSFEDATEDRDFDLNVDSEPQLFDLLSLRFDDDASGTWDLTDDERIILPFLTGSGFIDATANPAATDDLTVDGVGRMTWQSGVWTAEYLLPRTVDARGQDPDLTPGAVVPFQVVIADGLGPLGTTPRMGSLYANAAGPTSAWQALPLPTPLDAAYAPKLTPSTGNLVVISDHESPKGELYSVDLATGALVRRTFNDRYEDWVSVAPDGSFATYGSAPIQDDFAGYEIYEWLAGSGLELPLTLNTLLDGHPAVSPDGKEIAFARFTTGPADIFVMQADGTGVAPVTSDPAEENDPEWTKDGNLVIKTSVFTGQEQLATYSPSGTLLQRLTNNAYSDHDPFVSANNEWVWFERFEASGPWAADFNLTNSTAWPIVGVKLDGTEERLLVDDGLVNWLPISGPLGVDEGTLLYFRSTAFNGREVRMVDRFGVDHGRLLPGESHIRYMDWK